MPKKRPWLRLFLCVILLPLIAENYLYLKGFENAGAAKAEMRFNQWVANPVRRSLGWDNDPNSQRYTLAVESATPPDYKRLGQRRGNYLVVGCSCTFGVAVEPQESFVYLLRQKYPQINFDNYAVPGYSTYQCYKKLKMVLQRNHNLYDGVIYCNLRDHLRRNTRLTFVKDLDGLRFIGPRVIANEDGKYEYTDVAPVAYWPGTHILGRSVWFLQVVYLRAYAARPCPHQFDAAVFNDLIARMASLCRERNMGFTMVWLDRDNTRDVSPANRSGINIINAVFSGIDDPRYQVPGDGHANAEVHKFWAKKIAEGLKLETR